MSDEKTKLTYRQTKHLSDADILEEINNDRPLKSAILTVAAIIALLLVWASLTSIEEVATAKGEVVPLSKIKPMQHLEGGILTKLYVKNGDHVYADTKLAEFDQTNARSELEQSMTKQLSLTLDIIRLKSYLNGQMIDVRQSLADLIQQHPDGTIDRGEIAKMLNLEQQLLAKQKAAYDDKAHKFHNNITGYQHEVNALERQMKIHRDQLKLMRKEKAMYDSMDTSVFSEAEYIKIQRSLKQAQAELSKTNSRLHEVRRKLTETKNQLAELKSNAHEITLTELSAANDERAQLSRKISKLKDTLSRTTMVASEEGIVKGLDATVGQVLAPGAVLMELVPIDSELVVEVEISPQDIGHVEVGDKVNIKVDAYDYARYGNMDGVVNSISATTFKDDEDKPYYRGTVQLAKSYFGDDPNVHKLMAGMTATADIITGEKTIMAYMLKPIHTTIRHSLHER